MKPCEEIEIRVVIRRPSVDYYRIHVMKGAQLYFECNTNLTDETIEQATALLASAVARRFHRGNHG